MLDYGIIGNCVTSALVKKNASIEWMCYPNFDSPSILAKLLDNESGGSFELKPVGKYRIRQRYLPNTAILETSFKGRGSSFVVYDFFPRYNKLLKGKRRKLVKENRLVRIIRPIKGRPRVRVVFKPAPRYASYKHGFKEDGNRLVFKNGREDLYLHSNADIQDIAKSDAIEISFTRYFVLDSNGGQEFSVKRCLKLLSDTRRYWEGWCRTLVTPEYNRDLITRSAITLKLLTFSETGSMIAAATTSLPEELGTERTWDYRFCWIRDAAFCADSLKKIGRDYEPQKLMEFVLNIAVRDDFIQPMYGIRGETRLTEKQVETLKGYRGSGPVRIGNAAHRQVQNDIYGGIIDIFYLYFVYYEYGKIQRKHWRFIKYIVNQIKFNWYRKDCSIWEYRDLYDHYTYSKFMCYVGVDRAIRIAQHIGKGEGIDDWIELRDEIRKDIADNAYDNEIGSFAMAYGNKKLDASLLLMAYHEFLERDDPRLINTIRATYRNLRKGYKVRRYDQDDFGASRNAFTVCTFWLVDALYYIGEEEKARDLFKQIIGKGNHLGLFSETLDIRTGKMLGNFPQAYVHMALINSSILLSEWSSKRKKIDWRASPRKKWF